MMMSEGRRSMKKILRAYDKKGIKLKKAWLTNEHSACNYEFPVVSIDGIAYGAADIALNGIRLTAANPETIEWGKTQFFNIEFENAQDRYNEKMIGLNIKIPPEINMKFRAYCEARGSNPNMEIKKMIEEVLKD
jgi:hypothetical protein